MKKKVIILLLTAYCSLFNSQYLMAQVGSWRNYLSYAEPKQIQAAGDDLFVLASGSLYQYNQKDQSIFTYDKVRGMSDVSISHIRWCQQAKRLVVVYSNSNIDLVETNGNITNINSLYSKSMTGDKTVKSIRIDGIYAYLVCGFGIVKVNVQRAEIADTYTPTHPDYPTTLPEEDNSDYEKYIDLVKTLKPDGPQFNYFGYMKFANNRLYTANGDYVHPSGIQIYSNQQWENYQHEDISKTTGLEFVGAYCLDIDPADANHVVAGARNGLYEFRNGQLVKLYNSSNSVIEPFDGKSIEYEIVSGVKFDNNGDVWLLNSQAPTTSLIKFADGEFSKHNHETLMTLDDGGFSNKSNGNLSNMMTDSQGYLWFVNNHGWYPAFYRYNTQTDELLTFDNFTNQDGSAIAINSNGGVRCVAEDKEGNVWAGTSAGPVVLEKDQIESSSYHLTQVKVPRNDGTNYADYLLANIDIMCMMIDGANRKWFGTNGQGVYLISADNMEQIQHFTTENSPLLSNIIQSIAIDSATGEVFFGTENGLCSYMSDATQPNEEMTKDNVWAYPNPVTPDYTGPITITGLSYDADIKILAANGALVNEGRSNGGTYSWDGCDQQGRRVASGIYMVATATSDGNKGTVCKIAIVR